MNTKRAILAVAVLCAAALATFSCVDKEKIKEKIAEEAALLRGSKEPAPVPVKIIEAAFAGSELSTNYVGRVEPSKNTTVLCPYPGTLEVLTAVKGRRVAKGQVIARIKSEAVQSAYDIAKATLEQAEDGYARANKVYESGSVTEVKMVEIRTQLEKARAAAKSAERALEDCDVKAPFGGVVDEVFAHTGEQLAALAPLATILDVGSVEIHFSVPENEYAKIPLGAEAIVEVPALEKTVRAQVAVKGVSASALSHAYDFTLKGISDPLALMPGMVCKVHINSVTNGGLAVPASAVMTDMQGRYIWGVDAQNTVCKKYITVGGFCGKEVIVSEGLEEGDKVIVEGSRKVSTGMKVIAE